MIETTQNSVRYPGGTGEITFPIPFPFGDASHLVVEIRRPDGTADVLAVEADYIVAVREDCRTDIILTGDGVNAAIGGELVVTRRVPLTQETRLPEFSPVSPQAVEQALDKLTMIAQQLDARLGDCIDLVGTVRDEMAAASLERPGLSHPSDSPVSSRPTGPAGEMVSAEPAGPDAVMVTRSGVYHTAECLYATAAGRWLNRGDAAARYPKARPCRLCDPGPLDQSASAAAAVVEATAAPEETDA
ncbi:MAG: hypothetical protein LUG50_07145 [Planctomycetaceae bacterium]|nr:hypothetical protein [Planctomycetaceae bacterium]